MIGVLHMTRTFDPDRTYYLGTDQRSARGAASAALLALPRNTPVTVGDRVPDSEGEVWVRQIDGPAACYMLADCVLDAPEGFAVGDRFVIDFPTDEEDDALSMDFRKKWQGLTGQIVEADSRAYYRVKLDGDRPDGFNCQPFSWPGGKMKPLPAGITAVTVASRSAASAAPLSAWELDLLTSNAYVERARADAAERALADFKTRVRDYVIADSAANEWESHADDLLAEFDLESRLKYDGPVHVGSILKLKDGRIAVIADAGDSPFAVVDATASNDWGGSWYSSDSIAEIGIDCVLHDNHHYGPSRITV